MNKKTLPITVIILALLGLGGFYSFSQSDDAEDTAAGIVDTETVEPPEISQEEPAGEGSTGGPGGQPGSTDDSLTAGPMSPGEHGPFSAADSNRDGSVSREEIESFMDMGPERRIGLVAFFDQEDVNGDRVIDADELATVDPAFAFDGTDANADGIVSRAEVEEYVEEPGRLYRKIGLGEFFELADLDGNDTVSPDEIESAHESGILARDV